MHNGKLATSKTFKGNKCDHDTLNVGSDNSAGVVTESDISKSLISVIKEISCGNCSKKQCFWNCHGIYLEFGFTWCGDEGGQNLGALCSEVLWNVCYETHEIETTFKNEIGKYERWTCRYFLRCGE